MTAEPGIKVSIPIITYNHERYIGKALDGVLMQKTDFDYEIVVGEDCSTDSTRSIILEYQAKHPGRFKLFLNEKNLGMHRNAAQTLQACRGKYIAMLDGDDYWTSPDKLQKQVDFLEGHPECSVCFHDALIVYEDGGREPEPYRPSQKPFSTVEDLLVDNYIPTASVMYRSGLYQKVPDWVGALKMGDWLIHILNAHHGKIGYLDERMAVYLVHAGGVWSTKDWRDHAPALIEMFEALGRHLEPKYRRVVRRILRWRYFSLAEQYQGIDEFSRARACMVKAIAHHLRIACERPGTSGQAPASSSLPENIASLGGRDLYKMLLRLYLTPLKSGVVPPLKKYAPCLYNSFRFIAVRILKLDF